MKAPVLFELQEQPHGLDALLRTKEFSMQDMNVMLSTSQAVISLIHPLRSEHNFRKVVVAPSPTKFTGFDVDESPGNLVVSLYTQAV